MRRLGVVMLVAGIAGCGGRSPAPATPGAVVVEDESTEPDPGPPRAPEVVAADEVCGTPSADAARLFNQGVAAFEERADLVEAERAYRAALVFDDGFCDAMDNLAVVLRRTGRLDEAVGLYRRSIALAPTNQFAWQNLGVALMKQGKLADATGAYTRLIEIDATNPEGWYGRGQVAHLDRRYHDAAVDLTQARARYLARGDVTQVLDAELLLGLVAVALGDHAQVRTYLEPQAERVATNAAANLALGAAFLDAGGRDLDKARRYLTRARVLGAEVPAAQWAQVAP